MYTNKNKLLHIYNILVNLIKITIIIISINYSINIINNINYMERLDYRKTSEPLLQNLIKSCYFKHHNIYIDLILIAIFIYYLVLYLWNKQIPSLSLAFTIEDHLLKVFSITAISLIPLTNFDTISLST